LSSTLSNKRPALPVPISESALLDLVRHMAQLERHWLARCWLGRRCRASGRTLVTEPAVEIAAAVGYWFSS